MSILALTMNPEAVDEHDNKFVPSEKPKSPKSNDGNEKQVRFNERVILRSIDCIPEEEKEIAWYTSADYDEAANNEITLRKCISKNDQLYHKNQENLNAQGVLTEQQALHMKVAVESSMTAVFEEQEKQEDIFFAAQKSGVFLLDFESIAEAYRKHSQEALDRAHRRAVRHATHMKDSDSNSDTKPAKPSSPSSPTLELKKGTTTRRSPKSRSSRAMRKLIPKSSVLAFMPKVSSKVTPAS